METKKRVKDENKSDSNSVADEIKSENINDNDNEKVEENKNENNIENGIAIETVIGTVFSPNSTSDISENINPFPGIYTDQLPRNCFLNDDTIIMTTPWGSVETIITVEISSKKVEKIMIPLLQRFYCFQYYCSHIQYNEYYNKHIYDFIPMFITNYFGVEQSVNFLFGSTVHEKNEFWCS